MYLNMKPEYIVSKDISDKTLESALKEAFDLRLRRHDEPKTAELQKLMLEVVPIEEINSLGMEHLPYFLDCYSAWIILEYLERKQKITLCELDLQRMFDFGYLDAIIRKYEDEYVGLVQKMRSYAN